MITITVKSHLRRTGTSGVPNGRVDTQMAGYGRIPCRAISRITRDWPSNIPTVSTKVGGRLREDWHVRTEYCDEISERAERHEGGEDSRSRVATKDIGEKEACD